MRKKFKVLIWKFYILSFKLILRWLPERTYVNLRYRWQVGRKLNLDNPKTFNEKLQWLKFYNRNPEYTKMVDKVDARKYVSERIGEKHIVPLLGVWNSFDEIDFNQLPNSFVLKCNHDSGSYVIVEDKKSFDAKKARKRINRALKRNFYYNGKEWPYKNVVPRVFAEERMGYVELDYRFFCFAGEVKFIEVFIDGVTNRRVNLYTPDWQYMPVRHQYPNAPEYTVCKPNNLNEMINVASKLSENIPFLRVDLWSIDGSIYFNELTFFPNGGFGDFSPQEWDKTIGEYLNLLKTTNS